MRITTLATVSCSLFFAASTFAMDSSWSEHWHHSWAPQKSFHWNQLPSPTYRIPNSVSDSKPFKYVWGDWGHPEKMHMAVHYYKDEVPANRKPASYEQYKAPYVPAPKWLFPHEKFHSWE